MRKKLLGLERKRILLSEDHLIVLGFTFGVDSISEEVAGFSPFYGFPDEKHCVHCLLCLIDVLVILSVKDPNIMLDYNT